MGKGYTRTAVWESGSKYTINRLVGTIQIIWLTANALKTIRNFRTLLEAAVKWMHAYFMLQSSLTVTKNLKVEGFYD